VASDYGGQAAYGAQAWQGGQQLSGAQPGSGGRRRRGRGRAAAIALLVLGVAGLGVSLAGVAIQVLPRHFTAQQQRQIMDWEVSKRWRDLSAGQIFPASVRYPAPSELGSALTLTATRIGIAGQASCRAATDAPVAAVLKQNGCQAVLRATYADRTDSYVITVGVAAFPGQAQASAAHRELASRTQAGGDAASKAPAATLGVEPVKFNGTPATWFTDARRQISANTAVGTYVVFYTIGYADDRPRVPVASDSYAYSEMTSLGVGVKQAVISALAEPPPPPHCPGTPGC
jgi:hypothetical protein